MLAFAGSSAALGAVIATPAILVPDTLYHFTSSAGAQGIAATGSITPGLGISGVGVYGTAVNSASTVSFIGISTEAVVPFSPGLSAVGFGWPFPGLWYVVTPVVTTVFQSGVPVGPGR